MYANSTWPKAWALSALTASLLLANPAWADALITSGVVKLGVRDDGALNTSDPANTKYGATGLTYTVTGEDALTPGCWCEAWGVADSTSGRYGQTGASTGTENIVVESFASTATTATSVTRMEDATGPLFRVTHAFAPSASPNLYQATVTIQNIGSASTNVRYRRAMDWDVHPPTFNELTTIDKGSSSKIIFTSDDGFATGNPLAANSGILFTGNATDSGPADHGALFDFDFGAVAPGASVTFTILYGAAANQTEAMAALGAVAAEAYSLGKPDPAAAGANDGSPNTYIFGFAGVGGAPIFSGANAPAAVPVDAPAALAGTAALMGALGALALRGRRRRPRG
jgi:hypothetical protein